MELLSQTQLCAAAAQMDQDRAGELASFAQERGLSLVHVLVDRGGAAEDKLIENLSRLLDLPCLMEPAADVPASVVAEVSASLAINYQVMPLAQEDGYLRLACSDPFDWQRWDELEQLLDRPIRKVLAPRRVIDRMLKMHYGLGAETVDRLLAGRSETDDGSGLTVTKTDLSEAEAANEPTVVNLVNKILTEAIRAGATDVHFEPGERSYRVRYRIDGMLEDVSIPVSVHLLRLALVSRIKIMADLDITEKRLPQDGRCTVSLGGTEYDLRVSILPGIFGEGVVIRLQSRSMVKLDLELLGFGRPETERVAQLIARPHGLFLVTGPTGSGKTTTLYACLHRIIRPEVKIVTVEDPVEYWTESIFQMQIHEEIGFTFARALRSMLRHDPDVMLVGEIRDRETADMAVRASLTGHLVFATLHTNDAASAVTRLMDIGIEPFLIASSVHGILAQRLVRLVCPQCKRPVDAGELNELERRLARDAGIDPSAGLVKGDGCERCRFSGYSGRSAVGETLVISPAIRDLTQQRAPAEQIKRQALAEGMRTLRDSAMATAGAGRTTVAEVLRVTQEDA
jgi:type II secretory ATPase GspE/PulE/Tfp pilus assembly ATPase PilB-like protein